MGTCIFGLDAHRDNPKGLLGTNTNLYNELVSQIEKLEDQLTSEVENVPLSHTLQIIIQFLVY